jgi:hypothetical protein
MGGECLRNCGRIVNSRSGICPQCRTKVCKSCGKTFKWKDFEKSDCSQCDGAKKKIRNAGLRSVYGSLCE